MKLIIPILALTVWGCSQPNDHPNPAMKSVNLAEIEFLQINAKTTDEESINFEALISGTLQLQGPCIRLQSIDDEWYTPIWPADHSLDKEGSDVVIINKAGSVGKIGDKVTLSGGELRTIDHLNMSAPEKCQTDVYWLVASE